MKNKLMPMFDHIMIGKRAIIESVIDQLKNISQIEHTRHRSVANFCINLMAGLIAYTFREKKPSLNLGSQNECNFRHWFSDAPYIELTLGYGITYNTKPAHLFLLRLSSNLVSPMIPRSVLSLPTKRSCSFVTTCSTW